MDTAFTSAITATKSVTVNALATPAAQRVTNLTTLTPTWPPAKSNMLDLYARKCNTFLNPRKRDTVVTFLTRCSTKPNIDRDNATDQNPTLEPDSSTKTPNPEKPISTRALSSPNSSFSRGLVFDLGHENSWDSVEIGSPVVKRYIGDEEERWHMWYHGSSSRNPGSDSVGLAVSSNGIHWERGTGAVRSSADVGLVMNCGKDWWAFDTQSIRPCEVVIMSSAKVKANNSVYWLYYTGCNSEKVEFLDNSLQFDLQNPERTRIDDGERGIILKSLPGLAMSQDGRHWARIEGEHHSGALFDVGSNGEWDSLFIASPQVVFHGNGDLRMYYHSFDAENGHFAIGVARSRDGIKWVKLGKLMGGGANGGFDECGAVNAHVVRNKKDGNYLMVYEGVDANGGRSIGVAVSTDGLKNWQRVIDEAVLKPSLDGGWDCRGVGSPCLVEMDGDEDGWRLYYRGIGEGGGMGIGMAVSEGNEIRKFRRWTGFHL